MEGLSEIFLLLLIFFSHFHASKTNTIILLLWFTQVHKMGGEIKVVKKNGPGTLMQLYMVLNTPVGGTEHHYHIDFANHGVVVSKNAYS